MGLVCVSGDLRHSTLDAIDNRHLPSGTLKGGGGSMEFFSKGGEGVTLGTQREPEGSGLTGELCAFVN